MRQGNGAVVQGGPSLEREIVRSIASWRPHKTPRLSTGIVLWVFGLYAALYAVSPVTVTPQMEKEYRKHMRLADAELPAKEHAMAQLRDAQYNVYAEKEWFWYFKPAVKARVRKMQAVEYERQQEVAEVDRRIQKHVSDAKGSMGIWSDYGLMETRRLFWDSYESGKVFARRQTFYDAMFAVLYGRTEEHFLVFILKWLFNTLVNFTVGMSVAVMSFIFQLPSLLWSFQASLLSGLAFFLVAALAGVSVVAGYLGLLWGAGAGGAYFVVRSAVNNAQRLEDGRQGRAGAPRYIYHQQQRPHHD